MRQFINGSDQAFAALEHSARGACVRFGNQEMPAGCTPGRATVGFEVDAVSGEARLLVSRGLVYDGGSGEIADWLRTGERRFDSFSELKSWVRGNLRQNYQVTSASRNDVARLLRVPAVHDALRDPHQALQLNQQELEALLMAVLSLTPPNGKPS